RFNAADASTQPQSADARRMARRVLRRRLGTAGTRPPWRSVGIWTRATRGRTDRTRGRSWRTLCEAHLFRRFGVQHRSEKAMTSSAFNGLAAAVVHIVAVLALLHVRVRLTPLALHATVAGVVHAAFTIAGLCIIAGFSY